MHVIIIQSATCSQRKAGTPQSERACVSDGVLVDARNCLLAEGEPAMRKKVYVAVLLVLAAGVLMMIHIHIQKLYLMAHDCDMVPMVVMRDSGLTNKSMSSSSDLKIPKEFKHWVSHFQTLYGQDIWDSNTFKSSYKMLKISVANAKKSKGSEDRLPLFRDIYEQDSWSDKEYNFILPGSGIDVVHYLWCGKKQMRFQHYLGLLSSFRILRPLKLVFHYTHLPQLDSQWYNTWFQEFKQSMPNLVLRPLNSKATCGSKDMLKVILGFLAQYGGVYVGEGVILSNVPQEIEKNPFVLTFATSSGDLTRGIILSKSGFDKINTSIDQLTNRIAEGKPTCGTVEDYNKSPKDQWCTRVDNNVYPRDTWEADTHFAELARWIYYGRRETLHTKSSPDNPIPRISHYVLLKPGNSLKFFHFLSILSTLYVGGFHHVYIHGDEKPTGQWWQELSKENVTFVKIERPEKIFQQDVGVPAHISGVIRILVLHKYGGAYQDLDTVWASRVPDDVLTYPTVVCPDWPRYGEWPETFNTGVLLSRQGAPWLRRFLASQRFYRDGDWGFNSIKMSYRVYEHYPEELYVDRHLQVICYNDICHPTWHDNYIRDMNDRTPAQPFRWTKARAFHFTFPKIPSSLDSANGVKNGKDVYAEIGRQILKESKREHLLK